MRARERSSSRKISNRVANVAVCFLLIQPITARATLVERDFVPGSGDKLITLDTSTGLEWLDLAPTINQSVFDVGLNDFGGYYSAGFRYATTDEVGPLRGQSRFIQFVFPLMDAHPPRLNDPQFVSERSLFEQGHEIMQAIEQSSWRRARR